MLLSISFHNGHLFPFMMKEEYGHFRRYVFSTSKGLEILLQEKKHKKNTPIVLQLKDVSKAA